MEFAATTLSEKKAALMSLEALCVNKKCKRATWMLEPFVKYQDSKTLTSQSR
jgi:hypothetical protein